jgi:hypothetical protein
VRPLKTLLITLLVLVSCKEKSPGPSSIYPIDFSPEAAKTINLSEFSQSVDYIPLETNSKCYINKIKKIKFFGDSIFIFNELGWNMGEILVFDLSGSFLFSFGQIGPGPEEIEDPRDIIKSDDSYLIWDRQKVSEFANTGKFKKKLFDAFVHGSEFFMESDYIYLYHGTEFPGLLTKYNLTGLLTDTLKPVDPGHLNTAFDGENVLYANNEYHLFAPAFDTVWTLAGNKIVPEYFLDFKNETTLEKFFKNVSYTDPLERLSALNSTQTSNVLRFLENDSYLFIKYIRSKKSLFKIINKSTHKHLDFITCINDIDNGIFDNPITMTNDYLVIPLEPLKIQKISGKNTSLPMTKLRQIGESIKENNNPVLMLCKLKL